MANIPFLNNAYFAGKVGIGTDSPEVKLDVRGQLLVAGDTPVSRIGSTLEVYRNGTTAELSIHQDSSTFSSSLFSQLRFRNGGNDTYLKIPQSGNGLIIDVESQANAFVIGTTGNVGIGTTSPSHRLTVVGGTNGRVARLGNLEFTTQAATYTGSSIEVTGSNSFIKYNSTLGHKFFTRVSGGGNTLEALTIAPDTGNVGIGKTSPLAKLHTRSGSSGVGSVDAGTSAIIESNTTNYLRFLSTDSSKAGLVWTTPSDNFAAYLRYGYSDQLLEISTANSNDGISFSTGNASEKMRILSSGNVGIGTTSPSAKLEIAGAGNQKLLINRTDGDNFFIDAQNGQIRMRGSDPIYMGVSGDLLAITNTNVGIGTTGPLAKLHLSESAPGGNPSFILQDNARSGAAALNYILLTDSLNTNQAKIGYLSGLNTDLTLQNLVGNTSLISSNQIKITAGTNTLFENSGSEKMRITSSGNVGIGVTSPSIVGGTAKLTVNVGSGTSSPVSIVNGTTDGMYIRRYAGNGKYQIQTTSGSGNSGNLSLQSYGGNVGIGTTSPGNKLTILGPSSNQFEIINSANSKSWRPNVNGTSFYITESGVSNPFVIQAGGNVGIGTTSPNTKLHVSGGIIQVNDGTGITYYEGVRINSYDTNGYDIIGREGLTLSTVSANKNIILLPTGNVGIGTTSPSEDFEVSGDISIKNKNGANPTDAGSLYFKEAGSDWGSNMYGFRINSEGSSNILKFQGAAFAVVKDILTLTRDTGRVGIGTNSPSEKLHVTGNARVTGAYYDSNNSPGTSGQILSSTVTGTDWVSGSGLPGGPYLPLAGGTMSGTAGVLMPDNFKLNLGTSSDLQIYHDGSNSFMVDAGAGDMLHYYSNDWKVIKYGTGELSIWATTDAGVKLYYDNVKKFETTSTGVTVTGAATATTFLGDLNGTINTATTAVTKANATNDTTVATTAFVQNLIGTIPAGLVFQGTWNAATNTPTLTSGSGTTGHFYIVSTDGSTNLDGITDWKVGDWAVFVEQGASDQWEKVDNSSVLDGSGTGQKVTKWDGSGTSNTLTDGPITFSGNNSTFAGTVYIPSKLEHTGDSDTFLNFSDDTITLSAGGSSTTFAGNGSATFAGSVTGGAGTFTGTLTLGTTTGSNINMLRTSANYINATNATGYLVFRTGGYDTALTLTASQNATFAGDINIGTGKSIYFSSTTGLRLVHDGSNGNVINSTGDLKITNGATDKDIIFRIKDGASSLEAMRVDGSSNRVGIGTTSPSKKLEVNGTFKATGDASIDGTGNLFIRNQSATGSGIVFVDNVWQGGIEHISGNLYFRAGGQVDRMTIKTGGNVGIGTTSPSEKLHVAGYAKADTGFKTGNYTILNESGNETSLSNTAYYPMFFKTNNSTRMTISNAGNVGIGTTSPTYKLHVQSPDANDDVVYIHHDNAAQSSGTLLKVRTDAGDSNGYTLLDVQTNSGSALFVRGDRKVGIGTTSPTYKLSVSGGIEAGGLVTYSKSAGSLDTTGYAVAGLTTGYNGNSAGFTFTCFGNTGGYQKVVYSCYNGAGTWYSKKVIDEGTNDFDVEASANGSTITFTFKSTSGTKNYTPRVTIEATGHSINSTYA